MKKIDLSEVAEDLEKFLRLAADEEVVITREGKPAGVLIGFKSAADGLDWQIENDPRFLRRIARSRRDLAEQGGRRLEDLVEDTEE
jgi:prevent-host-death family protein